MKTTACEERSFYGNLIFRIFVFVLLMNKFCIQELPL